MTALRVTNEKSGEADLNAVMMKVQAFHQKQSALCDRLEHLADGLPDNFNSQEALVVARQIMPTICEAHRFEESVLFHLIEDVQTSNQSLERLKFEHWEDEASGEDLTDALLNYAKGYDVKNADKLAYMLRGFFDNLRRHIAFEAEHIIPAFQRRAMMS